MGSRPLRKVNDGSEVITNTERRAHLRRHSSLHEEGFRQDGLARRRWAYQGQRADGRDDAWLGMEVSLGWRRPGSGCGAGSGSRPTQGMPMPAQRQEGAPVPAG